MAASQWQGLDIPAAYVRIEHVSMAPRQPARVVLGIYSSQQARQDGHQPIRSEIIELVATNGLTYAAVYTAAKLRAEFSAATDVLESP